MLFPSHIKFSKAAKPIRFLARHAERMRPCSRLGGWFERVLYEACQRAGWQLFACGALSNHFHLCLGTPKGNLSEGMRRLQATFAKRFNRFRGESGHLFQGRFQSLIVEPGGALLRLVNYIQLNPLRAGLETAERLGCYPWSSLHRFLKRRCRPAFADVSWMRHGDNLSDSRGGWTRYRNLLKLRAADDPEAKALKAVENTRADAANCGLSLTP